MKIIFGVMSSKYSMKSNNLINGKMAMVLFLEKNIPIAIYNPKEEAFMPETFLKSNSNVDNEEVRKAFKSIRYSKK